MEYKTAGNRVIKKTDEEKAAAFAESGNPPWVDITLPEVTMTSLWNIINNSPEQTDARKKLAGNISKSRYIQDKDNWFYKNVLEECVRYLYYRNWNNYYEVIVSKSRSAPKFEMKSFWVNYMKQHEFNPIHNHDGLFSFVVFMKIPTHWKEQHALPFSVNSNNPCASNFQFILGKGKVENVNPIHFPLCPEDEGRMLFFPADLHHQVYPFYECEEERITISGNIISCQPPA